MPYLRQFLCALTLAFVSSGAFAATGDSKLAVRDTATAEPANPTATEAQRFREAGESACRQAVDLVALLGGTFRQMSAEMPRLMAQAREEYARVAPKMQELADRLRDIARQLEQQPPADNGS